MGMSAKKRGLMFGAEAAGDASTDMLRDVGQWISGLDQTGQDQPLRLCLKLDEPPVSTLPDDLQPIGPTVVWRLSLHLTSPGSTDSLIDAEQIWCDPSSTKLTVDGSEPGETVALRKRRVPTPRGRPPALSTASMSP